MGTRADFYIGRGLDAEWLGSIAWDGYLDGMPDAILVAPSEDEFREAVAELLSSRDDGTTPDMGWPWPWDDSRTTDYSYTFDDHMVYAACYGYQWFNASGEEPDIEELGVKKCVFPDMSSRKNVTLGGRSGLIILSGMKGDD
jgi:hypothetical protein